MLTQELQAPALKCSVEFLQTLHVWSIQDGNHVRKASDNQIAELCHAPDDLTGLFNTSPKHKAIKSAFPPKSCPGRGMALTSKAGADTGRTKWDQNKYYKTKKLQICNLENSLLHLKNPICRSDFKRSSAGTRRMFSLLPQAEFLFAHLTVTKAFT